MSASTATAAAGCRITLPFSALCGAAAEMSRPPWVNGAFDARRQDDHLAAGTEVHGQGEQMEVYCWAREDGQVGRLAA
jgi:hypothetical protein